MNNKTTRKKVEVIKEMSRQERCGSCGKKWDNFDNFEDYITYLMNKGTFNTTAKLRCLEVVMRTTREDWENN